MKIVAGFVIGAALFETVGLAVGLITMAIGGEGLRLAEMTYLSEGQIPEEVGHGAVL